MALDSEVWDLFETTDRCPPAPVRRFCPVCRREPDDWVYVDRWGQVAGCDRCLRPRADWEVLPGQDGG